MESVYSLQQKIVAPAVRRCATRLALIGQLVELNWGPLGTGTEFLTVVRCSLVHCVSVSRTLGSLFYCLFRTKDCHLNSLIKCGGADV